MKCLNEEDFGKYLDNELDSVEREEIIAHLASCQSCRERLDEMELLEANLQECLVGRPLVPEAGQTINTSSCPSQEDLLAYLTHELPTRHTTEIERHLKGCDSCIEHLNLLARIHVSLRQQILEPVPEELKDTVFQRWQQAATERGEREHKQSSFKLVIRLITTGFEILRDSIVPSDVELNLLSSPALAGAFRSAEEVPLSAKTEVFVAKKQIADSDFQVKLEMRKESDQLVTVMVTLSKAETPFSDARVSLMKDNLLFHSKKTGSRGDVEFANIPPGQYVLKISSELIQWPIEIKDH
jgi:anti-sigma factor RsiW